MSGLSVRYDAEGGYIELTQDDENGYFVDVGSGVFKRVNEDGETIGCAVLNVSSRKSRELPFDVSFESLA